MSLASCDRSRIFRSALRALLVAVAALVAAVPASGSEDKVSFTAPGFYLGASGVYTHNFFDSEVDDALESALGAKVNASIEDSWGANARLGYRATSWFAIEAQYEYIDEFDVEASAPGLFPKQKIFSIEGHTITVNTRWILPVRRTQPYILIGAGYSLYESKVRSIAKPILGNGGKQSGFAGRMGGGLDIYITPNIIANAEATALLTTQNFSKRDTGNIDDLWYVSLGAGLRYQF